MSIPKSYSKSGKARAGNSHCTLPGPVTATERVRGNGNRTGARCEKRSCQLLVHDALTYRIGVLATACDVNGDEGSQGVVNWPLSATPLTPRTRSVAFTQASPTPRCSQP